MNEAKAIREELAYIGRYLDGISPKLEKAVQLNERKKELQQKLKTLKDTQSGTNPPKWKKKKQPLADDITALAITPKRKIDGLTHRTNI